MPAVTVRSQDGGQLITRAASADAGLPHFTKKQNWRRDVDGETKREGHDYFNPLPNEADYQEFPFPGPAGDPLILGHVVRRPNGQAAIVVGTKSTLWRFNTDLSGYIADGYIATGYFEEPTRWQIIGSGFSTSGRRWEAKDIDGTTVFNNGDDLPVAYRVEWRYVKPLHELREQGIVCLGTIGEMNGVLLGGDVTELQEQDVEEVLNVIRSGNIKVSQAGYTSSNGISATSNGTTVTASAAIFAAYHVGRKLIWWNNLQQTITGYISPTQVTVAAGDAVPLALTFKITDTVGANQAQADAPFFTAEMVGRTMTWADGTVRKIVAFVSSQDVTVDSDFPVAAGEVFIDNPITYLSKTALKAHWQAKTPAESLAFDQRQYRLIWSEVGRPTGFAIGVTVDFEAGSKILRTDRMNRSLEQYDQVAVVGAGASGGVLLTAADGSLVKIASLGPGVIQLDQTVITGGTGTIQRSSSIGSIVGRYDVQDDGAAILKMAVLQNRMVIYTDTNIFLGRYLGDATRPWEFELVKVPHGRALHFRHTLASIQNAAHIYAGRGKFYQFDLTTRMPVPIVAADLVGNLFFDYASIGDTESIYAADNELTQEVWIVCPGNTADPVLSFDYVYKSFSTVDYPFSFAATVKAAATQLIGATGDWFLMGTTDGTLLIYGLTNEVTPSFPTSAAWEDGKHIFFRRHARPYSATKLTYTGKLASGLIHMGDPLNEKHFTNYVIQLSSQQGPSANVTVNYYTALNQSGPETLFGTINITDTDNHGLVPLHAIAHLIKDEVVTNVAQPVRLHSRTWDYRVIGSKSHHKK